MSDEINIRFFSVVREMLTTNHLSRRKRAYVVNCLLDGTVQLTNRERAAIMSHPVIRSRSKDIARYLAADKS